MKASSVYPKNLQYTQVSVDFLLFDFKDKQKKIFHELAIYAFRTN